MFKQAEAEHARAALIELGARWSEVLATPFVREMAISLLRRHPLRSADALQLAAAKVLTDGGFSEISFVTLDDRLRRAAQEEGFLTEP